MNTFAMIDRHSGYFWGFGDGHTPVDACRALDAEIDGTDYQYDYCPRHEARATYDVYDTTGHDVFHLAAWNDVAESILSALDDGRDERVIAAITALPYVASVERRILED